MQIEYTIKELNKTEEKYLDALHAGITAAGSLVIKDIRKIIQDIYEYHKNVFHLNLQLCGNDPKKLGQQFSACIKDNQFYNYIKFGLHMPEINLIYRNRRSFFEFNQKKSIDNEVQKCMEFVKLPMKRLPQYLLLMQGMTKKLEKIACKSKYNNEALLACMEGEKAVNKAINLMDRALDFKNLYFERKKHLV